MAGYGNKGKIDHRPKPKQTTTPHERYAPKGSKPKGRGNPHGRGY